MLDITESARKISTLSNLAAADNIFFVIKYEFSNFI